METFVATAAIVAALITLLNAGQAFLLLPYRVGQLEQRQASIEARQDEISDLREDIAALKADMKWVTMILAGMTGTEPPHRD